MNAALKLEPPPDIDAAERLAMLRALPLSPEPLTDEEIAMFEQLEADVREGRRGGGPTTAEILETLEQMRRDAGE